MALPGFDQQVTAMDAGLLDSKLGFGSQIIVVGDPDFSIDADFPGNEDASGLRRSGTESASRKVRTGVTIEVMKSALPQPWEEQTFMLSQDSTVYSVGELDDSDPNLLEIILVPVPKAPGENGNQFLRD